MESLWMEDESDATLEEVLAFIDSSHDLPEDATDSDQSASAWSVDSDPQVRLAPSGTSDDKTSDQKKPGPQNQLHHSCKRIRHVKKPKARAENHKAVSRYRKRNKEEILELRAKLQQMETQLAQLQANRNYALALDNPSQAQYSMANGSAMKTNRTSLEVYVHLAATNCTRPEFRKLQQSIQLNQKLKASLTEYINMSKTPEALLKKPITKHDLNSLFGIEDFRWKIRRLDTSMESDVHSVLLAELHHYLENLYLSTFEIPRPLTLHEHSENVFVTRDPIRGQTFEMTSLTRVNCHRHQLVDHVWSHLTAADHRDHHFMKAKSGSNKNSCEKQVTMALNSPQFGEISIRGVSSVRRFDEPDRSVIVFTSRLVISEAGLLFRQEGWLIVSSVSSGSSCNSSPSSTLLQIFYRVFGELSAAVRAVMPEKSARLHEFVLNALGQRMRVHHLEVQNTLVQELDAIQTGGLLSSSVLTKCPV
ncbi:hypothetical protein FI667_g11721, partial [Globisporangium splendens]